MESGYSHLLRDSAIALAFATALLFFCGFLQEDAYYSRLGIPSPELEFPPHHYMSKGTTVFVLVLTASVLPLALDWLLSSRQRERPPSLIFNHLKPFAVLAIAASFAAAYGMAKLGDQGWKIPVLDVSIVDIVLFVGAGLLSYLVAKFQWPKKNPEQNDESIARGPVGQLYLGVLFLLLVVITAHALGSDRGNDRAWGCVSLPEVEFETLPENLEDGHAYWLIAHQGGNYYLRDVGEQPNNKTFFVVQEEAAGPLTVAWTEAQRDC